MKDQTTKDQKDAEIARLEVELQKQIEAWATAADDRDMANGLREKAEADLTALRAAVEQAREALKAADYFITNGVELGFIRMPDLDTPDPAHRTPGLVRAALAALSPLPVDGQETKAPAQHPEFWRELGKP